jgi:thymidylate kinase
VAIHIQPSAATEGTPAYPPDTIPALAELLADLDRRRVRYCSWKSNEHLGAALGGRTDVDLLVDPADAQRFRSVLEAHDVEPLLPPPRADFPGMRHYLGFDRSSGRLFHLHVHELLVLGERYVKNHHLPLEREMLDSVRPLDGVPVPSPELELVILAARSLLKYRARDVVKDVLKIRTPGLHDPLRAELDWLLAQTDDDAVRRTAEGISDVLPAGVVRGFLETYRRDPRDGLAFLALRERLRSALRARQRRGRLAAVLEASRTAWDRRAHLRRRPPEVRMQPEGGGMTIGLVGADGSGKSTVAAELASWLGWKLQVRALYLGSKEPSRPSRWSYLVFRALRRGHRELGRRPRVRALAAPIGSARDGMLALHHLSIARDRLRRHRTGVREAAGGKMVVFDRFPLTTLSVEGDHRLFDGPQIRSVVPAPLGRLTRALADVEERSYRTFTLPDLLLVLEVSPEVAIGRKPDHRPEVVTAKSRAAAELATLAERRASHAVARVDADRPLDEVLLEVRRRVWDAL